MPLLMQVSDAKIQQWSNGKQGNIRALLSTLQYVFFHHQFFYFIFIFTEFKLIIGNSHCVMVNQSCTKQTSLSGGGGLGKKGKNISSATSNLRLSLF